MDIIIEGIKEAFNLIFSFDPEVFEVVFLSLRVSLTSLLIASLISIPLAVLISKYEFIGKHFLMRIIYTLMGLPPVLCGLVVYILFMRRGPLGYLSLNYTVTVMIIAQTLLITPIILGLTINIANERKQQIFMLTKTLGANRFETMRLFIYELRIGVFTAVVTGFSRAISEVGPAFKQEVVKTKEKKVPSIDEKTCAGCSVCVENCPMDCLKIEDAKFHGDIQTIAYMADPNHCIGCGICAKVCPIRAIVMKGVN